MPNNNHVTLDNQSCKTLKKLLQTTNRHNTQEASRCLLSFTYNTLKVELLQNDMHTISSVPICTHRHIEELPYCVNVERFYDVMKLIKCTTNFIQITFYENVIEFRDVNNVIDNLNKRLLTEFTVPDLYLNEYVNVQNNELILSAHHFSSLLHIIQEYIPHTPEYTNVTVNLVEDRALLTFSTNDNECDSIERKFPVRVNEAIIFCSTVETLKQLWLTLPNGGNLSISTTLDNKLIVQQGDGYQATVNGSPVEMIDNTEIEEFILANFIINAQSLNAELSNLNDVMKAQNNPHIIAYLTNGELKMFISQGIDERITPVALETTNKFDALKFSFNMNSIAFIQIKKMLRKRHNHNVSVKLIRKGNEYEMRFYIKINGDYRSVGFNLLEFTHDDENRLNNDIAIPQTPAQAPILLDDFEEFDY